MVMAVYTDGLDCVRRQGLSPRVFFFLLWSFWLVLSASPFFASSARATEPEPALLREMPESLMPAAAPPLQAEAPAVEEEKETPSPPQVREPRPEGNGRAVFPYPSVKEGQGEEPGRPSLGQGLKERIGEVDLDLKRFGYDFFQREDGPFRPDPLAQVGPDYVVGPGDSLKIDLWGNIEGNYLAAVDRNGEIVLPKVGVVSLWGQTFAEARETIRKQVAKYFTNFEINVTMGTLRSIQVFLVGEVRAPGTYTVSSLSTVLTALSEAGGPSPTGSLRNVQLLRGGQVVAVIDFYDFFLQGDRSRDVRLQSGDTLFVPVVGPLVGVAGNVRRPAIYELSGKETLGKVLELAGGIIPTAYLNKIQVERVQAHQKMVVLDLDVTQEGDEKTGKFFLQDRDLVKVAPIAERGGFVQLTGYATRPGKYQLEPGMRLADLILPYDNLLPEYFPGMAQIIRMRPPEYRQEILTVNLEKALAGDPEHNLPLEEYDTVRLFSREEMEEKPEVMVSGAVLNPGTYPLYERMTVKDLIAAAGNLRRRAYLAEAEITRFIPEGRQTRTERLVVDLEKALAGDPENDLLLQPEDHLFVRSIPDYGEKRMVTLQGEVLFPGTYIITHGERLSSVLERAGGFAEGAYLRGAVFTRESLKEMQRQRLEKLINEQEQEIYRLSGEIAAGALSKEELESARSLLESRNLLLQKLKQAPVTGRMVVLLAPLEKFKGSAYDIELADGDTLTVPKNPRSVTVLGQVYNPISIAYRPGKTVSYYLSQVGGPSEEANTDEMFVVRADGTVYSKQQAGLGVRWDSENFRWVFGGFNVTELYPGDTVLVPQKFKRVDIMREVKDLTTILYQMALGAAAVASF